MSEDGCTRSAIRIGLRVAIVLKEDQPTGKRTIGEVASILTSDSYHHRGIKVRLRSGQVGRVQEILTDEAPAQTKQPPIVYRFVRELVVLAIERSGGALYTRMLEAETGESLLALGLDANGPPGGGPEKLLARLLPQVTGAEGAPFHLFSKETDLGGERVLLHAFLSSATEVADLERHVWTWTGWKGIDELQTPGTREIVSEESQMILEAISNARRH